MKLLGKSKDVMVLDVDGTVLDLMARYWSILNATVKEFGLPLAPALEYRKGHYNGTHRGNPRLGALFKELWPKELADESKLDRFRWRFRAKEEEVGYPLVLGARKSIEAFRRAGAKVALCTMSDEQSIAWKLAVVDLKRDQDVDLVVTRESTGYEKPDPRILDPVWREFNVGPERAEYVGDWYVDREVALNAGVDFDAVLSGGVPRWKFIEEGVPSDRIFARLWNIAERIES
jgi:phosphoglycolate phosphatase-like HAD superfamily hydrolase